MKLICDIVEDLLPLYEDDICSEASRTAVEEHLKECSSCRKLWNDMKDFKDPQLPESAFGQEDKVIVKSFRKVHRRWLLSLLAMFLVIPVILLSINQSRQEGICFTNLDEIWIAGKYVQALQEGNFEKAASYMNYEYLYNEIQDLLSRKPEDYKKSFRSITLGGKEWMVSEEYYQRFFSYEKDEQNIWTYLIYNTIPDIMIPVDVWEDAMALEPNVFQVNADGSYEKDGYVYTAIEYECGTFMMEINSGIFQIVNTADFYNSLDLMPMEFYEEGEAELEAAALHTYQYIQEKYVAVYDMTAEDFEVFMKEHYVGQLEEYVNLGYSIKKTGLDENNCYYVESNGRWHIGYEVEISSGRNVYLVTLIFSVEDGKVRNLVAINDEMGTMEDGFLDILHLSYPE